MQVRCANGSYNCAACDVGGAEKMEGQTGRVLSHPSQGQGVQYPNSLKKEWYIKVTVGYHVELTNTIHDFVVSCLVAWLNNMMFTSLRDAVTTST
jgi:hypothetical protein